MRRNEEQHTMPAAARVLGYFIPVGAFMVGAYMYEKRKKRLGRKPAKASDLDHSKSKYKIAYDLTTDELAGVTTTAYPAVGQTVRVTADAPVGTVWHAQADPAASMKVEQLDVAQAPGATRRVFYFTVREPGDARATLTAIGPGNQTVDSVTFDVEVLEE